jgi:hypothetical protein
MGEPKADLAAEVEDYLRERGIFVHCVTSAGRGPTLTAFFEEGLGRGKADDARELVEQMPGVVGTEAGRETWTIMSIRYGSTNYYRLRLAAIDWRRRRRYA